MAPGTNGHSLGALRPRSLSHFWRWEVRKRGTAGGAVSEGSRGGRCPPLGCCSGQRCAARATRLQPAPAPSRDRLHPSALCVCLLLRGHTSRRTKGTMPGRSPRQLRVTCICEDLISNQVIFTGAEAPGFKVCLEETSQAAGGRSRAGRQLGQNEGEGRGYGLSTPGSILLSGPYRGRSGRVPRGPRARRGGLGPVHSPLKKTLLLTHVLQRPGDGGKGLPKSPNNRYSSSKTEHLFTFHTL